MFNIFENPQKRKNLGRMDISKHTSDIHRNMKIILHHVNLSCNYYLNFHFNKITTET